MISIKLKSGYEKILQVLLILITYVMIIFRFLMNEKGRVNPDSIRYMRQSRLLPIVDNTTAPLGYPFSIKLFTYIGLDEFWSSKVVGLLAYSLILILAYRKKFFFKELVVVSALFSFVSIFSFTMSEALTLPFVILLFYVACEIIHGRYTTMQGIIYLSSLLIILLNIRYSSLFLCCGTFAFGLLNFRKHYAKSFLIAGLSGIIFYGLYKFLFIDYFNENYIKESLEIGLHPTSKLLKELFQGLTTTFNPFIHIADPNGGIINYGIYGIGILTIATIIFIVRKIRMNDAERFIMTVSIVSIICSYFIQYFYWINPMDYRLLAPFVIGIWMIFLRRIFILFDDLTYSIAFLSLATGFIFTWLSRGNYLENRREISNFLKSEKLIDKNLRFFITDPMDNAGQMAELISTVNPNIRITMKPSDTLKKDVLTEYKVESKIKIKKNNYQ